MASNIMTETPKHSFRYWFMLGVAFQFVLSLPAGIAQSLGVIEGISGEPLWVRLFVPFFGIPFNTGGCTIRVVFELLVEPLEFLVGHRSATVLSNLWFYLILLAGQVALVAFVFAVRCRHRRPKSDSVVIGLAVAVLVNSLLNVTWPWWGT